LFDRGGDFADSAAAVPILADSAAALNPERLDALLAKIATRLGDTSKG
jgi:hypothetical protein